MGVEAMTLCAGCNYPIPSWQHQGACKPVAEKVPPITRVTEIRLAYPVQEFESEEHRRVRLGLVTLEQLAAERVTENHLVPKSPVTNPRGGRPRVTNPSAAALRQREARAKKRQ